MVDEIIKKNIAVYDKTVEGYYQRTKDLTVKERQDFLSYLKKGAKILDLACGPGRDSKFFSEHGFKVVGVDLSLKSIEKAKIVAPKASFKIMNFLDLDFKKEFDAVWFCAGLLCVKKSMAEKAIESVRKSLKDNGVFYISVKKGNGEGFEFDERCGFDKYYAYYSEKELRELLKDFEIMETFEPDVGASYKNTEWIAIICRSI